jgi:hypothetical protein
MKRLGYRDVRARVGHGFDGWPGHAPYDAVVPTAAPGKLSQPLLDQIRSGHRGHRRRAVRPHDGEGRRAADRRASTGVRP